MEQINLYDLIKFYGRKWRVIVALTLAGFVAGFVYNTFIQVPMYQSNSKLILVSSPTSASTSNQTLINNYIDLITSRRVLEPIIGKQDKTLTYEKLVSEVKAVNQKDTAVIDVTVTTNNAKQSAGIANEITDSFKTAVNDLYQTSGVIVVDQAVEPTSASNVNKTAQIGVAALSGFLLAIVVAFFTFDYRHNHPVVAKFKKAKKITKTIIIKKPKTSIKAVTISTSKAVSMRFSKLLTRKTKPVIKAVSKEPSPKKLATKKVADKIPAKKTVTTTTKKSTKKPTMVDKTVTKKKTPVYTRKR